VHVAIASAQAGPPDVFLRGVPSGTATAAPLRLTLADAVKRGLDNNLGGLIEAQRVRSAEGTRWRGLGDTLPHLSGSLRQSEQQINLAAFGFTGFAGLPSVIGPFGVFDARIAVSAPILDLSAHNTLKADSANLRAEQFTYKSAREEIVLVVANLYLQAVADSSRVQAARSQVSTAETVVRLAEDQRSSGLVAGIEVLRQQVQLAGARQRLIAADAAAEKDKLVLARSIGLPAGQAIELVDVIPFAAAPSLTLEQATTQAYAERDDLRGAEARVDAARAAHQAASGYGLPTVHLDADYGALGTTVSTSKSTYALAATVRVPIFEGGSTRGRVEQADADLRQREAELADLRAGIQYQVAATLLDLKAAAAAVDVARDAESLARQQVEQAQDRFRAGVGNTIELVQAQDALAEASDRYIASLYTHNVAKASLARALGVVERRFSEFLGGQQ
jgi:outer membrane protein TolC